MPFEEADSTLVRQPRGGENWRETWMSESQGLRAIQGLDVDDDTPGEAAALAEALRRARFQRSAQEIQALRTFHQGGFGCSTNGIEKPGTLQQEVKHRPRSSPASAGVFDDPDHGRGGATARMSAMEADLGKRKGRRGSASSPRCSAPGGLPADSPTEQATAIRTSFSYMAGSPTYKHKGDICWFGQGSRRRAGHSGFASVQSPRGKTPVLVSIGQSSVLPGGAPEYVGPYIRR